MFGYCPGNGKLASKAEELLNDVNCIRLEKAIENYSIYGVGKARMNRMRNERIHKMAGVTEALKNAQERRLHFIFISC